MDAMLDDEVRTRSSLKSTHVRRWTCRSIVAVIASLLSVAAPSAALGSTILFDSFETYQLGVTPPPWNPTPSTPVTASLDPDGDPNQVLEIFGVAGGADRPVGFTAAFEFSAYVYNESATYSSHPSRAYVYMRNAAGFGSSASRALVGFTLGGNVVGLGASNVLGTYQTDVWHHVSVVYELAGTQLNLTYHLDGVLLGQLTQTVSPAVEASMSHLQLTSQSGYAFYDDVRIEAVPEPSAGVLVGVGLAAASLCSRNRRHQERRS